MEIITSKAERARLTSSKFTKSILSFISIALLAVTGQALAVEFSAEVEMLPAEELAAKRATKTYIVQLRDNPIASYDGQIAGLAATKPVSGQKIDMSSPAVT